MNKCFKYYGLKGGYWFRRSDYSMCSLRES